MYQVSSSYGYHILFYQAKTGNRFDKISKSMEIPKSYGRIELIQNFFHSSVTSHPWPYPKWLLTASKPQNCADEMKDFWLSQLDKN